MSNIDILVPIYNESRNIDLFLERVATLKLSHERKINIYFVADPCTDDSIEMINLARSKYADYFQVNLIETNRRIGQAACIQLGFNYTKSECVLVIDVDLQDPIELIPEMINEWGKGYKVVLAKRVNNEKNLYFYLSSIFYVILNLTSWSRIPTHVGDFRLLDKEAIKLIQVDGSREPFLRGQTAELKMSTKILKFKRNSRLNGESKYSSVKQRIVVALQALFTYSIFFEIIVLMASIMSLIFVILSITTQDQQYNGIALVASLINTIGVIKLLSVLIIKKNKIGKKDESLIIKVNTGELN